MVLTSNSCLYQLSFYPPLLTTAIATYGVNHSQGLCSITIPFFLSASLHHQVSVSSGGPVYRWPRLLSGRWRSRNSGLCCGSWGGLQPAAHWSPAGGVGTPSGDSCSSSSHTLPPGAWSRPGTWTGVHRKFKKDLWGGGTNGSQVFRKHMKADSKSAAASPTPSGPYKNWYTPLVFEIDLKGCHLCLIVTIMISILLRLSHLLVLLVQLQHCQNIHPLY